MMNWSPVRTRLGRVLGAFVVLLSAVVLVPGGEVADAAGETFTIGKAVDHNSIYAGAVSTWTLHIETNDEVALATGISVTDIVPDGLCPYGAGSSDCPAGPAPSLSYSSAVENADGTWTLVWDLADMGPSESLDITYTTLTRSHYREGFAAAGPVLARDSWNNLAHLSGSVEGTVMDDYASASQAAGSVALTKEVANRPASLSGPSVCGGGGPLTWEPVQADGYRVGDQVCWRITVDYPAGVATRGTVVSDALPSGHLFTANDAWAAGANNTVPLSDIDGSANSAGDSALVWTVGDSSGDVGAGESLEIVFSSTIVDPQSTVSGDSVLNSADVTHTNTSGGSYTASAGARVQVLEPELNLIKGVTAINGAPLGGGADVDGVQVMAGDVITYQLTITNIGGLAASNVEIWDLLPARFATCSTNVSAISGGGTCIDGSNRIEWNGPASMTLNPGEVATQIYDVTFPSGISPTQLLQNRAGIRSYESTTNNGAGSFTYIPAGNIDAGLGGQNTTSADDASNVVTGEATIGLSRVTGVGEAGNDIDWQATIGETITYTAVVTIPEGTSVYGAELVDDLPSNLDLVSSSHTYTGEMPLTSTEEGGEDIVTVEWPDPYTNGVGTGDDILTLTIVAKVLDVPSNARGVVVANSVDVSWLDQDDGSDDLQATIATTIVEPLISLTKSSTDSYGNDGVVIGGETVQYLVEVDNAYGGSVSTAHDVVVVDTLPEGMTPTTINDGGIWVPDPTPGNGIGGTITWNLALHEPGSPVSLTYWVAVDNPVVVSSVFTNNAAANSTSMAGPVAGERTAGPGYAATAASTLVSPLMTMAKSVIPTSATIGEEVVFSLAVTVPAGMIMYDATILDVLPSGLVFDGIVSTSCAMGAASCSPGIDVQHVYQSGQTTSFFLSDIDLPSTEARVFTVAYRAHLDDLGVADDLLTNQATIYGNTVDLLGADPGFASGPFHVSTGPIEASVRIIEPSLAIDKDVAGQAGDSDYRRAQPGQTLYYTIVVSNDSGPHVGPAYDVTVVDHVPSDVTDPTSIFGGGVWSPGSRTITWTIPGPLGAGTSVAFDYEVTALPSLDHGDENPGGAELVNTADITSYYGVNAAERLANGHSYREYTDTTADVVSVELDMAQLGDQLWFDVDNNGSFDSGEPPLVGVPVSITYHGADGALGTSDDEAFGGVTGADGTYGADRLPGGVFTVVVDDSAIPAGLVPSYNLDATVDHSWSAVLGEASSNLDIDFGYTGTGTLGDTVWFDIDADGILDAGEFGLEGVSVTANWLGIDGIRNGDDLAYVTVTDGNGSYQFSDLPAGIYEVEVASASLPAGMVPTFDADGVATAHTSGFLLSGGDVELGADFGYAGGGSIGDLIWLDSDGEGDVDVGEPGLLGVPVQLTWPGEDGLLGGSDDELILTTTGVGGSYTFANLPYGDYRIEVLGGLPAATVNTWDRDGDLNSSTDVTLSGGPISDADFGYQGSASIGDSVWWDMNADGLVDVGEPGIPGVGILLEFAGVDGIRGNADDLSFTTTTDAAGIYLFTDLPEGDYVVSVTGGIPVGMTVTSDGNGPIDGRSAVNGLGMLQIYLDADFGYAGTGSVGDLVWLDLNTDGVQGGGEPGIPGVNVDLIWYGVDGSAGTGDDVTLVASTDIDGSYAFNGIPDGNYRVTVNPASLPVGALATHDADGVGTLHTAFLALGPAENNLSQDFGYAGAAFVGDTLWFDRDSDGTLSSREFGLGGVTLDITWAGPNALFGDLDDEVFSATTDSSGHYVYGNLLAGSYAVSVDVTSLPLGMAATFDADGTLDHSTTVVLGPVGGVDRADFGYSGSGVIGDFVWLDLDSDGSADAGEPGIPQIPIEVTWAGPDGTLGSADDQLYETTTDPSGWYAVDGLPPGTYSVAVTGNILTAATNIHDPDLDLDSHAVVTLGDGVVHGAADFGYVGSATIGDLVWLDLDGDGVADAAESGIPNVELTATWYGGDGAPGGGDDIHLPTYSTDAAGIYWANGLPDGNYRMTASGGVPPGLVNTAAEDGTIDDETEVFGLVAGDVHDTADFGYAGAGVVEGTVWWDLDGNGFESPHEPGLGYTGVALTWAGFDGSVGTADDAVLDTMAALSGAYRFEHLPPGEHHLAVDESGLPPGVSQSADPDGSLDGATSVVLEDSETITSQSFGYRGSGSIGGFIWWEVDGGGERDAAEPGVAGAVVTVTYLGPDDEAGGGDDVAFATTSDATGNYLLLGLPSGFYSVVLDEATLPPGASAHIDRDGGDPLETQLALGLGASEQDIAFGLVGDSVLAGRVWNDRNGDGLMDPEEVGIAGIRVMATWQTGSEVVTVSAESDPFGYWEIGSLPSGRYVVTTDMSSLPLGMAYTTAESVGLEVAVGATEGTDIGLAFLLRVEAMVWLDQNSNGSIDAGEPGIEDVLVNLYDESGSLTGIAETGTDGFYLFADLSPGVYRLQLDRLTLPDGLLPTSDPDGLADLSTLVDLTAGSDVLDTNFGFQVGLPVTGFNLAWFAMWGALLLACGCALVTAAQGRPFRIYGPASRFHPAHPAPATASARVTTDSHVRSPGPPGPMAAPSS